jgi:hypothetical protein
MLAEQLPAPMLAGLLLVKPYLSADLSRSWRVRWDAPAPSA